MTRMDPFHGTLASSMIVKPERRPSPERELARAVGISKAPAISRAAAVLRLLGKSDTPLGVQFIARKLGLVPSTCLYILRALVAEAGVLTLARHWLRRNRFNDLVQPVLNRIGEGFGVTMLGVHIVGLEHITVIASSQAENNFQLSTQIGSRFPALISATGRCIAAFGNHSESELATRFKSLRWDEAPTLDEWKAQVDRTRVQGFAVDSGNYISGVTVVAAPVWKTPAQLSYALVAIGIGSAVKRVGLRALGDALRSSAKALSNQLCGEG